MRNSVRAALLAFFFAGASARADIVSDGYQAVQYSYEISNMSAFADFVFVAWGREMGSDFVVVPVKKPSAVPHQFASTLRFYALPLADFPVIDRVAQGPLWERNTSQGEHFASIAALDAKTPRQLAAFFEHDPRVRRSALQLDVVNAVHERSALATIHDVLSIVAVHKGTAEIVPREAVYGYADGSTERLRYTGTTRPTPSRLGALVSSPYAPDLKEPERSIEVGNYPGHLPGVLDRNTLIWLAAGVGAFIAAGIALLRRRRRVP